MDRFIVLHTDSGGEIRVNISKIVTYIDSPDDDEYTFLSFSGEGEYIYVKETPEEIDRLIESALTGKIGGALASESLVDTEQKIQGVRNHG